MLTYCGEGGGGWSVLCLYNSQERYVYYTRACFTVPSLGAVTGVFITVKNVIDIKLQQVPKSSLLGTMYYVLIAYKIVVYIILQHVPILPHLVCLKLTRILCILYSNTFQ